MRMRMTRSQELLVVILVVLLSIRRRAAYGQNTSATPERNETLVNTSTIIIEGSTPADTVCSPSLLQQCNSCWNIDDDDNNDSSSSSSSSSGTTTPTRNRNYNCSLPGLEELTPGQYENVTVNYLSFATEISSPNFPVRAREFEACVGGRIVLSEAQNVWEDPMADLGGTSSSHRTDSHRGSELYDGYFMSYSHFPEASALGLAEHLNDRIRQSNARLKWEDVLPKVKRMGEYRKDGRTNIDFLMYDGDFFVPIIRLDLLEQHSLPLPNTWNEVVEYAKFFNGTDLNDDGEPDYGFCHFPRLGAGFWDWWWPEALYSTWATYDQTQGLEEGFFFDAETFEPRTTISSNDSSTRSLGGGFAMAAEIWKDLWRHGEDGCITDHMTTGRCAIGFSPPGCWKGVFLGDGIARKDPNGTIVWRPTMANGDYAEPYRFKPFGSTHVLDRASGEMVQCTEDTCPKGERIPPKGHFGNDDRASVLPPSFLAGQWINRAPFYWSGGLGTLIRNSSTPVQKDMMWDFFVYTNSPDTSVYDVSNYASWLDSWRYSQLLPGENFLKAGWSQHAYEEHAAVMQWALSNDVNGAMNLRIPGLVKYTRDVVGTLMSKYIADEMDLECLSREVTSQWNKISAQRDKLSQLEIYRAQLGLDGLSEVELCRLHRVLMDQKDPSVCRRYDDDRDNTLSVVLPSVLVPSIVLLLVVALYVILDRRRRNSDSVWLIKADELKFEDPPEVLGRGTFGLVLLGEYRGTQVAVKRTLPPKPDAKTSSDMTDSDLLARGGSVYIGSMTGFQSTLTSGALPQLMSNNPHHSGSATTKASNVNSPHRSGSGSKALNGNSHRSSGSSSPQRTSAVVAFPQDRVVSAIRPSIPRPTSTKKLAPISDDSHEGSSTSRSTGTLPNNKMTRRNSFSYFDAAVRETQAGKFAYLEGDNDVDVAASESKAFDEPTALSTVDLETGSSDYGVPRRRSLSYFDARVMETQSGRFAYLDDDDVSKNTSTIVSAVDDGTESEVQVGNSLKESGVFDSRIGKISIGSASSLGSLARKVQASLSARMQAGARWGNTVASKTGLIGRIKRRIKSRDEYEALKNDFIEEMRHLSKLRHPCITTVMGAVIAKDKEPMLVMEYMDHGSLYDILHNETVPLEGEVLLPALRDIAQGMRFLHAAKPMVIHGDLKAQNVLVDSRFRAKVADFGLSAKKSVGACGTPFWMAPELLRGESRNTSASDVYSFGIILYEVYSRKDPYYGEDPSRVLVEVADPVKQKRPPVPTGCPPSLASLMTDSVNGDPDLRPSFEEIDLRLKRLDIANAEPAENRATRRMSKKHVAGVELLYQVFPRHIADALREGRKVEPEKRDLVTIFFSDIVGFTSISTKLTPEAVSDMLDRLYLRFDELSQQHDIFKVETVGDAYMCATNLVKDQPDDHVKRIADFAVDAVKAAGETLVNVDDPSMGYIKIRVGFHSGPVIARVVGSRLPKYSIFGDAVNTASRMESTSQPGKIQCSRRSADILRKQSPGVILASRGEIQVKGRGEMETFYLEQLQRAKSQPSIKSRG